MAYFVNRVGSRYRRLVVLEQVTRHAPIKWKCRCDCGKIIVAIGKSLAQGSADSCGCLRAERLSKSKTKHGACGTGTYRVWMHMRQRCENPTDNGFPDYGGRGIRVCERWRKSFSSFFEDMGEKPTGKSINRINNDGNYEPSNCKWATESEQANNRRGNRVLEFKGKRLTVSQWSMELGLSQKALRSRVQMGWPVERILSEPVNWYRKPWRENRVGYA